MVTLRDGPEAFVLQKIALGEIADFTTIEGYSPDEKPVLPADFLRRLLLDQIPGVKVLSPGVRISGATINGVVDLRDCGGESLAPLALDGCDFTDAIHLSNARLARLSIRGSKVRAVVGQSVRVDGDVILAEVGPLLEDDPVALIDLREARIGGSLYLMGAKLKALSAERGGGTAFTLAALDIQLANIGGGVLLGGNLRAEGAVLMGSATIGGQLQCSGAQLECVGGIAFDASSAVIKGSILLDAGFAARGQISLHSAVIAGSLQCRGGTFSNPGGVAIMADNTRIEGLVMLDTGFSADGRVSFFGARAAGFHCGGGAFTAQGDALNLDDANISGSIRLNEQDGLLFRCKGRVTCVDAHVSGSLDCTAAQLSNPGATALSANDIRVGGTVILSRAKAEGEVSFSGADVRGDFYVSSAEFSNPHSYALTLQSVRVAGELQAFDNKIDGTASLSGAYVSRLYDDCASAWTGAAALALDGLRYGQIPADPWFFEHDEQGSIRRATPVGSRAARSQSLWSARTAWLKRNTGDIGKVKVKFSNQPWRECASAVARAGQFVDARRIAREEQREANRHRAWWKRPFVFFFAELPYGYGLSATRATVTAVLLWAIGCVGVDAMLERGALVDARASSRAAPCTGIEPALYALDVGLPVLDLKQEILCEPGFISPPPTLARANLPLVGEVALSELTFWQWAKALYAIVCALGVGVALLTYSGVFKPKADA
ncbi:MAG: hypothetical protein H7124_15995 [Phycisphaerales bacterium]|nr:hypothetical protein [Hyphomonadaceae bacterium]